MPLRLLERREARRTRARGRCRHPHRRVRLRERPGVRRADLHGDRLVPRRPQQRRHPRRDRRPASRCCARPAATPTRSPRSRSRCSSRSTGSSYRPTATCAPTRCTPSGKIPYQRYRAWQLAGRTAGIVGLGAVGRATKWRLRGPRPARALVRPVQPRRDAHTSLDEMLAGVRRRVDARGRQRPRPRASWARRSSRRMKPGSIYVNSGPCACCTTPTRSSAALQSGHLAGAGLDHFEGEHLPPDHPLCAMHERRAHAAHRRRDLRHRSEPLEAHRRRRRSHPARRQAGQLREPGGAADDDPEGNGRGDQGGAAVGRAGEPAHESRARHRGQLLGPSPRRERRRSRRRRSPTTR